jgi:hypothetical protein
MADEITHNFLTGKTLYFCRFREDGNVLRSDPSLGDEVWGTGSRTADDYDVAMTEEDASGHYKGDFASGGTIAAGTYYIAVYYQKGAAADYPTLRTTTAQSSLGLTETTAISDATDLQNMQNNRAGNYYLTGDIDASATSSWNGGDGFEPIGTSGSNFTGTLDGNGYTITGLTIDRASSDGVSLLGYCSGTVKVEGVTLASVNITGDDFVGALIGEFNLGGGSDEPVVQDCHASGTVSTTAADVNNIGGLIGRAVGTTGPPEYFAYLYDCSSSVAVDTSASSYSTNVGGFIGFCEHAKISNCYATGAVDAGTGANSSNIGGFVGQISDDSYIEYCYATGDVRGNEDVGGFVGEDENSTAYNGYVRKSYATGDVTCTGTGAQQAGGFGGNVQGEYTDCYAWGDVTGGTTNETGGFIGLVGTGNPTFTSCYSIGAATCDATPGGFVGADSGTPTYTDCYWDTEASGNVTSEGGTGRTTASMKTQGDYAGTWDFTNIWQMPTANAPADSDPVLWQEMLAWDGSARIGLYEIDVNITAGDTRCLAPEHFPKILEYLKKRDGTAGSGPIN